jgi:MATE family multidrug resistance protein
VSQSFVLPLLRLAGPVALARLGIMGMGIVDVIVVGQLAAKELPHQALGWAPTGVVLVTGIGLLTGVQVLAARAIGEGTPAHAGVALKRGLAIALIAGGLSALGMWVGGARMFTLFGIAESLAIPSAAVMRILALSVPLHLAYVVATSYLEAIQRPIASTIVMWAANALNLVLNLVLVPQYGAQGSAWSTVAARGFLGIALIGWIVLHRDATRYGVRGPVLAGPSYRALLAVGAAAAVSHAVESGAFSAMTVIAGRLGEAAVSAYQILLNLLAVVFMIALGLSAATAVLVSEAIGRGAPRDAARAGWTGLWLNTLFMLAAAGLVILFRAPISRAYTSDLTLATLIVSLIPLTAAVMPPDGGQVVTASALRARGDNWFPTASHILAYAIVMPGIAFWLAELRGAGVAGLIIAIFLSSVVSIVILAGRFFQLGRGAKMERGG